MTDTLQERIRRVLSTIRDPRTGADVLAPDSVRDIATTTGGKVRLALILAPGEEASVAHQVREAVARVEGVTDVRVDVALAGATPSGDDSSRALQAGSGRALPVMDTREAPPRRPAPTPVAYPQLGQIIAVSSGKGGVGKSTVATNVAVALARQGARVGLMDADIYGPNVPRMMGVNAPPAVIDEKIIPLEAFGVKLISLGFLIDKDQPAIWRGPIVMKIITQFLRDVAWGELDVFIVDMPPGTGDAQLSLVQATHVHGAIIVTTPQDVAVGDALRGAKMFQRVGVPVIGIVENMSWFECPHCGKPTDLFGSGGGERLAHEVEVPLLAQIPLYPRVREGGDQGRPIVVSDPESTAARALLGLADRLRERVKVPTGH